MKPIQLSILLLLIGGCHKSKSSSSSTDELNTGCLSAATVVPLPSVTKNDLVIQSLKATPIKLADYEEIQLVITKDPKAAIPATYYWSICSEGGNSCVKGSSLSESISTTRVTSGTFQATAQACVFQDRMDAEERKKAYEFTFSEDLKIYCGEPVNASGIRSMNLKSDTSDLGEVLEKDEELALKIQGQSYKIYSLLSQIQAASGGAQSYDSLAHKAILAMGPELFASKVATDYWDILDAMGNTDTGRLGQVDKNGDFCLFDSNAQVEGSSLSLASEEQTFVPLINTLNALGFEILEEASLGVVDEKLELALENFERSFDFKKTLAYWQNNAAVNAGGASPYVTEMTPALAANSARLNASLEKIHLLGQNKIDSFRKFTDIAKKTFRYEISPTGELITEEKQLSSRATKKQIQLAEKAEKNFEEAIRHQQAAQRLAEKLKGTTSDTKALKALEVTGEEEKLIVQRVERATTLVGGTDSVAQLLEKEAKRNALIAQGNQRRTAQRSFNVLAENEVRVAEAISKVTAKEGEIAGAKKIASLKLAGESIIKQQKAVNAFAEGKFTLTTKSPIAVDPKVKGKVPTKTAAKLRSMAKAKAAEIREARKIETAAQKAERLAAEEAERLAAKGEVVADGVAAKLIKALKLASTPETDLLDQLHLLESTLSDREDNNFLLNALINPERAVP